MARLPKLPYHLSRSRPTQLAFGALNHTATAADGEIYDERDVSTDEYPALVPRKPRLKGPVLGTAAGEAARIGSDGVHLFWHAGQNFHYNGSKVMTLPLAGRIPRRFACIGERIIVWPDKVSYDSAAKKAEFYGRSVTANATLTREHAVNDQYLTTTTEGVDFSAHLKAGDRFILGFHKESLRDLEGTYTVKAVTAKRITLRDESLPRVGVSGKADIEATAPGASGAYWMETAHVTVTAQYERNRDMLTLDTAEDLREFFKAGDAVIFNGDTRRSYSIDEVAEKALYFEEASVYGFLPYDGTSLSCKVSSEPPELDHMCVCDNRIFGCRGSEIYACKLGDPSQWYYWHSPSLSTDSWYLDTGDPSPFTACCVYGGRPHFFTEHSVTVLYGDSPAQYSTATAETYGVKAGAADSLVEVGGALFYLSPQGFVRYTSSEGAAVISDKLGSVFASAVAGTDGRCYYVCAADPAGRVTNYKHSLKSGLWSKEDGRSFTSFATLPDRLFALAEDGTAAPSVMLVSGGYNEAGETVAGVGGYFFYYVDAPAMEVVLAPLREDRSEGVALRSRWVHKLYLRLIRSQGAEIAVSVCFDGGEEREIMRLQAVSALYDAPEAELYREEIVRIPLPNNKCDTYRIIIRAQCISGAYVKLLGLVREHYTFR